MSKEIKMSDFFNLPIRCEDIRSVKFNCRGKDDEKVAILHYAVVHAAENYDRLVEENARLTEIAAQKASRADELFEALESCVNRLDKEAGFTAEGNEARFLLDKLNQE